MATIIRGGSSDPTKATCQPCLKRGRRGGMAIFSSSRANDLNDWLKRHEKHT